jgi:hypothetical protein
MNFTEDIIKEYVIKNSICTTKENIDNLCEYFQNQGYNTIGLVCDALIADSIATEILTGRNIMVSNLND